MLLYLIYLVYLRSFAQIMWTLSMYLLCQILWQSVHVTFEHNEHFSFHFPLHSSPSLLWAWYFSPFIFWSIRRKHYLKPRMVGVPVGVLVGVWPSHPLIYAAVKPYLFWQGRAYSPSPLFLFLFPPFPSLSLSFIFNNFRIHVVVVGVREKWVCISSSQTLAVNGKNNVTRVVMALLLLLLLLRSWQQWYCHCFMYTTHSRDTPTSERDMDEKKKERFFQILRRKEKIKRERVFV